MGVAITVCILSDGRIMSDCRFVLIAYSSGSAAAAFAKRLFTDMGVMARHRGAFATDQRHNDCVEYSPTSLLNTASENSKGVAFGLITGPGRAVATSRQKSPKTQRRRALRTLQTVQC